jgi:hypothetical protein
VLGYRRGDGAVRELLCCCGGSTDPSCAHTRLLMVSCTGGSATKSLARYLIPSAALERAAWDLKVTIAKSTWTDYGVPTRAELGSVPSESPTTLPLARAVTVVERQWLSQSGAVKGVLPEGIYTVVDTVAAFGNSVDASSFVQWARSSPRGHGPAIPVVPGATYETAPFGVTGQRLGQSEYVVMAQGDSVMVVQVVGGGFRPTLADATARAQRRSLRLVVHTRCPACARRRSRWRAMTRRV